MLDVLWYILQCLGALIGVVILALAAFVLLTLLIEGAVDAYKLWKEPRE